MIEAFEEERLLPHSFEAEEAVLGSLLIDEDAVFEVAGFLKPDAFYRSHNRWIYDAILSLNERHDPVDYLTVTEELRRRGQLEEIGGESYVLSLVNAVPTSINAESYAKLVEAAALRRRLISAAGAIARLAYDEAENVDVVLDRAEQTLFSISEQRATRDLMPIREVAGSYLERIEQLRTRGDDYIGVPTGFVDLDRMLGGLNRSDLVIVAARPGMGKTSLQNAIALTAARRFEKRIAIFNLEMSAEQLVQRMVSAETHIDSQRLRRGDLHDNEWELFYQAIGRLSEAPIFIDDTPSISPLQLRTKCRRLYAEYGLDLIMIDYLQLMQADRANNNRVQEISEISRGLKALARELDIPVVAASQLSRAVEQRQNKRPVLSDLRESGCLTGDTLIPQADTGERIPLRQLIGHANFAVWALNPETYQLERASVSNAFTTGVKQVYKLTTRLGRTIRSTANHKFLTIHGWRRLDQLFLGQNIASSQPDRPAVNRPGYQATPVKTGSLVRNSFSILQDTSLSSTAALAPCDWDQVVSIEADGKEEVFDLTVSGLHNFVANDIIVHNSIEQDADVVVFIYRDEYYNPDTTERPNIAEISIAKHRNGPTGTVDLFWHGKLATFRNLQRQEISL